jgi:hypothetical protein
MLNPENLTLGKGRANAIRLGKRLHPHLPALPLQYSKNVKFLVHSNGKIPPHKIRFQPHLSRKF